MSQAVEKLEVSLGPDTTDLKIRVGIHRYGCCVLWRIQPLFRFSDSNWNVDLCEICSGQVTAGVLRGDRTRFQLFGDSMNLASRYVLALYHILFIYTVRTELTRISFFSIHPFIAWKPLDSRGWYRFLKPRQIY